VSLGSLDDANPLIKRSVDETNSFKIFKKKKASYMDKGFFIFQDQVKRMHQVYLAVKKSFWLMLDLQLHTMKP